MKVRHMRAVVKASRASFSELRTCWRTRFRGGSFCRRCSGSRTSAAVFAAIAPFEGASGIRVRAALGAYCSSRFRVRGGARLGGELTIEPGQSALVVRYSGGVAARLAHDHVVQARAVAGSVAYDPQKPDASSIQVQVEVGSLVADEPATRRKFGWRRDPSAKIAPTSDGDEVRRQLAAERFPSISFASTAIAKQPAAVSRHGRAHDPRVTREVKFPARSPWMEASSRAAQLTSSRGFATSP